MIKEAIILAGGLGTRLRQVLPDLPKCMAPVNEKPFLGYVTRYFQKQGVEKFIFSLGYKSEVISDYIRSEFSPNDYLFSIEETPLGTGGAIKLACTKASGKNVFVINGDTLFKVDVNRLSMVHQEYDADCTLSLKPLPNIDRYNGVELNDDNSVKEFKEPRPGSGLINGGVYALNASMFLHEDLPEKFSFEKDYLEKLYHNRKMYGSIQDTYFIDIGIPSDYERAQTELKNTYAERS